MPAARVARRNVRQSAFLLTGPVPLRSGVSQPGWRRPRYGRARSVGAASSARERVFLGEQGPIAIKRPRIEEADPAMIGLEGATCNTALITEMEEIGANLLLAEHVGRALVVGS